MQDVVGAPDWALDICDKGYMPNFISEPPKYIEHNNRSALNNIEFLRGKIVQWENENFIEEIKEPAFCCSPLSVACKFDPVKEEMKLRPVLDLSRHVNLYVKDNSVSLDDLSSLESDIEKDNFMTVFDLKTNFSMLAYIRTQKNISGSVSNLKMEVLNIINLMSWYTG